MTPSSPVPDPPPGEDPPPASPEPGRRTNRGRVAWMGVVVILGLVAGWAGVDFYRFLQRPLASPVLLEIERGWPLARIAETLEQRGVVSSAPWFILLARWQRLHLSLEGIEWGSGIQAGEYECAEGETPLLVLTRLTTGNQVVHRLVIPEGLTVAEIGARMQAQGWKGMDTLLADPEITQKLGVDAPSLEGWLFPSTYYYRRHDTALEMLTRMVKQSQQVVQEVWHSAEQGEKSSPHAVRLSPFEGLILASIIEKETGQASERARVSAVFHNRLRKKMRLQSDPTVIYGVQQAVGGGFAPVLEGTLTKQNLKNPTPYNTYTQPGLPPTPICNPGKAAIQAALHPDEGEDLYFVARGEGFHVFAKTLQEHEANVDRYQRHPVPKKR